MGGLRQGKTFIVLGWQGVGGRSFEDVNVESRIVDVEKRLVEMNGACTTFSYSFNAILSDQPLVWFQILFLEPVLEDCFWVAGESRVLLELFWGWTMQHLRYSFSAVPRCLKSENGNKAIEVGVPWFPMGWTVGLPKHPSCAQDQSHGRLVSIWKKHPPLKGGYKGKPDFILKY